MSKKKPYFVFAANYKRAIIILMEIKNTRKAADIEVKKLKKEHPDASVFHTQDKYAGGMYRG